jgi:hypothetical protein
MVAPANKTFTGAGTITGSGNIMGNALQAYSFNFTANNQDADFDGVVMTFQNYGMPSYITDHMPVGQDVIITISGLTNAGMAFNGMQFHVINSGNSLVPGAGTGFVPGTDLTFPEWQYNWSLTGNSVLMYDGFTISWNA